MTLSRLGQVGRPAISTGTVVFHTMAARRARATGWEDRSSTAHATIHRFSNLQAGKGIWLLLRGPRPILQMTDIPEPSKPAALPWARDWAIKLHRMPLSLSRSLETDPAKARCI
jgi:hypothetical protein